MLLAHGGRGLTGTPLLAPPVIPRDERKLTGEMAKDERRAFRTLSPLKWGWLSAGALFALACLAGALYGVLADPAAFLARYGLPTAIAAVICGLWIPIVARLVRRVEIEGGVVRFLTLGRSLEVRSGDIEVVRPSRLQPGFYVVRSRKGTVLLPDRFTGFVRVVDAIKELNPGAAFKGL